MAVHDESEIATQDSNSTVEEPQAEGSTTEQKNTIKHFRDGTELTIRKLLETHLKDEESNLLPNTIICPKCGNQITRKPPLHTVIPKVAFIVHHAKVNLGENVGN